MLAALLIAVHLPRGARLGIRRAKRSARNFNPLAPWGRDQRPRHSPARTDISIHSPHAGRDGKAAQDNHLTLRSFAQAIGQSYSDESIPTKRQDKTRCFHFVFRCEAPVESMSAPPSHLKHQGAYRSVSRLGADVLHLGLILFPRNRTEGCANRGLHPLDE